MTRDEYSAVFKMVWKQQYRIARMQKKLQKYRIIFKQIVRWDDQRFATLIQDNVGISREDSKNYFAW